MNNSELLEKAIIMAAKYHKGQVDKAGMPYILHPLRLMMQAETIEEKITAVLHDIIEDTSCTPEILKNDGFPEDIINSVNLLSKIKYQDYNKYLDKISEDETAKKVKLKDLEDNMDIKRLSKIGFQDLFRLNKYIKARKKLLESM